MTFIDLLPLMMFFVLLALIILGFPVAFTLAGTALGFAVIGYWLEAFYLSDLGFLPGRIFGIVENYTLVAVPLFIFMGLILEKSGIAEELLQALSHLLRRVKGSLAYTVIFVGAILAASTGIAGATVVTMTVLALPTMLSKGYDKAFSTGVIAAAGTLGQIIPPSIILVLLGDIMNVDVGSLFVGAIIPGLGLVILYMLYVTLNAFFLQTDCIPDEACIVSATANESSKTYSLLSLFTAIAPPAFLMAIVLGSILSGIASPTEAAGCGALGALLITTLRRRCRWKVLKSVGKQTSLITTMVFTLLIGAQFFGVVFRGLYGDELIENAILQANLSPAVVLFSIMVLMFVLRLS